MFENREYLYYDSRNKHTFIRKLFFDKDAKTVLWGKCSLFNKLCLNIWLYICKKIELGAIPHTIYLNLLKIDHRPRFKS